VDREVTVYGSFVAQGAKTLIIYDFCPAESFGKATAKGFDAMAKLSYQVFGVNSICVGSDKLLVSDAVIQLPEIIEVAKRHDNIVFSGKTVAAQLLAKDTLAEAKVFVHGHTPGAAAILLDPLFEKVTFVTDRKTRLTKATIKHPNLLISEFHERLPVDCEIISVKEVKKSGLGKASSLKFDIYPWEVDGRVIRTGFTASPTYWRAKFYEEFISILARDIRFAELATPIPDLPSSEIHTLKDLQEGLNHESVIGLDLETTGLFPWEYWDMDNTNHDGLEGKTPRVVGNDAHKPHRIISVHLACTTSGKDLPLYVPHAEVPAVKALSFVADHPRMTGSVEWLPMLKYVLELPNTKVIHNSKFELMWLCHYYGLTINGKVIDTQLTEHTLHEGMFTGGGRYALGGLIASRLLWIPHKDSFQSEIETDVDEEELGGKKSVTWAQIDELRATARGPVVRMRDKDFTLMPRDALIKYGGIDAAVLLYILEDQRREFRARGMKKAWSNIVCDLSYRMSYSLSAMEYNGMPVDTQIVVDTIAQCDRVIAEESAFLNRTLGDINCASNKELSTFFEETYPELYAQLEFTKSGAVEIKEELVKRVGKDYPWLKNIFHLKHAYKVRGTYMIPFLQYASDNTVHFNFHISGPATGRLSSYAPNMQNIPYVVAGIPVKKCLHSKAGTLLVAMDLANAEVRMLANCSRDEGLLRVIRDNLDFHAFTASKISPYTYEQIVDANAKKSSERTQEESDMAAWRQKAKPVNFGIIYGITSRGLARQVGCSEEEAQAMIDKFYQGYPGVANFLEGVERHMLRHGYVETFIGRRRSFPILNREQRLIPKYILAKMGRKAKNFVIQSATSDWFQYLIRELIQLPGVTPHLTVHDSLVISLDESQTSLAQLYAHYHRILIDRPRELWPELMDVDMGFDLEIGLSYGKLLKAPFETIQEIDMMGMTGLDWVRENLAS